MSQRESTFGFAPRARQRLTLALSCLLLSCLFMLAGGDRARAQDAAQIAGPTAATAPPVTPATEPAPSEMNPEARAHYTRGLDLYAARKFAAAVSELELGYAIDPRREFLFAEAQALRLAGVCQRAVPLYHRFLETNPAPLQIEAARLGLDRCAPDRATAPAAPSAPPPPAASLSPPRDAQPPAPATVRAPPPPSLSEQPAWWRDILATSTIGVGVVALGLGTGFAIASNRARDDALSTRTTTYSEFSRLWESAQQRRAIAVSLLGAGTMLLAAGGVRLVFLHREQHADRSGRGRGHLSWLPAPGGGTLSWGARF